MRIMINTDPNIEGTEKLAAHVRGLVRSNLDRFAHQITHVEVHLRDENGPKGGPDDKRCMIEARLAGRRPSAVSHQAETVDQAVSGAARKLKRSIERTLGRLSESAQRTRQAARGSRRPASNAEGLHPSP